MTKADDVETEVEAQARAWLAHLRSDRATAEDAQAFRRWCVEHPQMASRLRLTWSRLRTVAADVALEDAASGRVWTGNRTQVHALRPGRRAFVGFAVAAGASWLALRPPLQLWPALSDFTADYRTGVGEQRQVALSGRVTVSMNTQTRFNVLSAQAGQAGRHDIDLLAGEAEIVSTAQTLDGHAGPVHPVVVVAGRGRLQAQVARFDVRRTGDQVCVTCVSGSIALSHPRRSMTLAAAQQVVYDDRTVKLLPPADLNEVTAWRRGLLVFNDASLAQVVDEINRYRPGKVILRNEALGRNRVQAQFPIAKLDDAIDLFGQTYGAHVTKLPGDIILLS